MYGVLLPDTRTYLVVGSSAGHRSGIGYKITQDDDTECGGYCAYSADDSYGYYWMFGVDDLPAVGVQS
jgi:hypothetical protein